MTRYTIESENIKFKVLYFSILSLSTNGCMVVFHISSLAYNAVRSYQCDINTKNYGGNGEMIMMTIGYNSDLCAHDSKGMHKQLKKMNSS